MIEKIVQRSRINELEQAIEVITDDEEVIIEAEAREVKETKRGSKFRGVSKNGKKWQVRVFNN